MSENLPPELQRALSGEHPRTRRPQDPPPAPAGRPVPGADTGPGCLQMLAGAALFLGTLWVMIWVVGEWVWSKMPPEGDISRAVMRDCLALEDGQAPTVTTCGGEDVRYIVTAAVAQPADCYRIDDAAAVLRVDRRFLCLTGWSASDRTLDTTSVAGVRAGFCRIEGESIDWQSGCGSTRRRDVLLVFLSEDATTDPVAQCHARGAAATELAETTRLTDITEPPGTELPQTQVLCAGPVAQG